MQPKTLALKATDIQNFAAARTDVVIFCEADQHLLFVGDNDTWGLPGGKINAGETPVAAAVRLFKEQTKVAVSADQFALKERRFARLSGIDREIHFVTLDLQNKPQGLKPDRWTSIFALTILDHLEDKEQKDQTRQEAFDVVYRDRIWKRVEADPSADLPPAQLIFQKGDQTVEFDNNRKLGIILLGKPHSGKYTQAEYLAHAFGLPNVSEGGIYQDEMHHTNAPLPQMLAAYDARHPDEPYPIETTIGMLGKRLAKQDCQAGVVLGGFKLEEETCTFLTEVIFRSGTDTIVPIILNIDDVNVSKRFSSEEADRKILEQRLNDYNRDSIILVHKLSKKLGARAVNADDERIKVFHRVCVSVQQCLENIATQPKKIAGSKADIQRTGSGFRTALWIFTALSVGVAAGYVLSESNLLNNKNQ